MFPTSVFHPLKIFTLNLHDVYVRVTDTLFIGHYPVCENVIPECDKP